MITPLQLWVVLSLDAFRDASLFFAWAAFFLSAGSGIAYLITTYGATYERNKDLSRIWRKVFRIALSISLISTAVWILVPTTRQAAAILVLPKILDNEKVQQLPNQVVDLASQWLEELKPKSK